MINVLMLDEKRVFCEKDGVKMQQYFTDLGMEPILLPFRHLYSLGGSFHCAAVNLRRGHAKLLDCRWSLGKHQLKLDNQQA